MKALYMVIKSSLGVRFCNLRKIDKKFTMSAFSDVHFQMLITHQG